jgi:hypothetical protein
MIRRDKTLSRFLLFLFSLSHIDQFLLRVTIAAQRAILCLSHCLILGAVPQRQLEGPSRRKRRLGAKVRFWRKADNHFQAPDPNSALGAETSMYRLPLPTKKALLTGMSALIRSDREVSGTDHRSRKTNEIGE